MQLTVHYLFSRRGRLLSVCFISFLMLLSQRRMITQLPTRRSCRRLVRNTGWWENVWNNYSEAQFKKTFRISRATFWYKTNVDRGPHLTWRKTCHILISTGKSRLLLYNCRNGGKRCFNCKLNRWRGFTSASKSLVKWLCFNTLAWFNKSFQRKKSRHGRALAIPLLLGSNRRLPYPNKVPSRRSRMLQRVPQLQKLLLYCLHGHGWFKVQIRMGKLRFSGKFPWCHYFQVHELMGRTSKMGCC